MAHRYWRVYIEKVAGNSQAAAYEIQLRETVGGADVTGSGTASADTVSGVAVAAQAFDDNTSTAWVSVAATNVPHWIAYDFGTGNEKEIIEVTWHSYTSSTRSPLTGRLEYSDDGTTWTTKFGFSGLSWAANTQATILPPSPYIQVTKHHVYAVVESASINVYQVALEVFEVQGYGSPPPVTASRRPIVCIMG